MLQGSFSLDSSYIVDSSYLVTYSLGEKDLFFLFYFFLRFYLFIHRDTQRKREAETQAEGEAGSMKRARRGTRSRASRITPWAAGGAKPLHDRGCPERPFLSPFTSFVQWWHYNPETGLRLFALFTSPLPRTTV